MKFDSKEQKELVTQLIANVQITAPVANLAKVAEDMNMLLRAITEAEFDDSAPLKPQIVS